MLNNVQPKWFIIMKQYIFSLFNFIYFNIFYYIHFLTISFTYNEIAVQLINRHNDSSNEHLRFFIKKHGLDIYKFLQCRRKTLLMTSVLSNNLNAAKVLLECGANLEEKENRGVTALMLASYHNLFDGFKFLLDAGGNVKSLTKLKNNALHVCAIGAQIEAPAYNDRKVMRYLLKNHPEMILQTNGQGQTPLHAACFASSFEAANMILEHAMKIYSIETLSQAFKHQPIRFHYKPFPHAAPIFKEFSIFASHLNMFFTVSRLFHVQGRFAKTHITGDSDQEPPRTSSLIFKVREILNNICEDIIAGRNIAESASKLKIHDAKLLVLNEEIVRSVIKCDSFFRFSQMPANRETTQFTEIEASMIMDILKNKCKSILKINRETKEQIDSLQNLKKNEFASPVKKSSVPRGFRSFIEFVDPKDFLSEEIYEQETRRKRSGSFTARSSKTHSAVTSLTNF